LDWRGQWLVGVRGLSGLEPSFETHQSLAPGLLIRKAEASTEWADNRSLALSLSGVGDPRASAQVHWADPTVGRGEFTWNRSEDVFQLESELHDLESVRERFGLRWQVESGTLEGTEWGWERFKKSALGEGSRYRWVSNSLFENVSIDRSETVDRLWVRDDATLGEWRLRWQPELTWWKDQDRRHFRIPNLAAGIDDAEDIRARGDAWLPVFRVHAAGPWSDQWQGDSEFIATYATRSYDVEGEVEGELSNGLPYTGTLDADGRLRAFALRWEVGGLWQYQEDLGLDVRLRFRREQEQATIPFEEALDVPGASVTELAETSSRLQGVDLEALGRWDLSPQSALDLGYGVRRESFSTQGSSGRPGNGDTGGLLLEFRSQISDELSLKLRSRAYSLSDPYTALTPEHRAKHDLDFTWTPSENTQIQAGWSQGRTRFSTAGDFAQMMRGHVFASWTQEDWRLHSGGIWRDYDTEISTVINSPLPQAWLAAFSGQSWTWHNSLSMQAKEDLVIEAVLDVLEVLEDSSSEHVRAELGILHDFGDRTQLQARAFWWKFDGTQADEDDYRVTGFELLYGRHF